eukprot:4659924-Pyramimonas_sp.AAC.2
MQSGSNPLVGSHLVDPELLTAARMHPDVHIVTRNQNKCWSQVSEPAGERAASVVLPPPPPSSLADNTAAAADAPLNAFRSRKGVFERALVLGP